MSNEDLTSEFLEPTVGPYSLDRYVARSAIVDVLKRSARDFSGTLLDVGCGRSPYKSLLMPPSGCVSKYLGLDLEQGHYQNRPDLTWNGTQIPLPDNAVDSVLATEVLEHCPEPGAVLHEVARVLKPNGFILLTVPFLWPLHDVPYDEFRYTPFSLERLMRQAGFRDVTVEALGGWDASLGQMLGLWITRRPMKDFTRRVLQRLALPIYRTLIRMDQKPKDFNTSVMITGLSARAWKQ